MSLRWKIVLILAGVSVLFCAGSYLVERFIVQPGFLAVEKKLAEQDVTRCVEAIGRDREHLSIMTDDWGTWDDTYQYMATGDKQYEVANLIPSTFTNTKLTLFALVGTDGAMRWGRTVDFASGEDMEIPGLLEQLAGTDNPLMTLPRPDMVRSGLLMTAAGPMLVAVRPVTHTDRSGPVNGSLIMGRLLDNAAVTDLAGRVQTNLRLINLDDVSDPVDREAVAALGDSRSVRVHSVDGSTNLGYAVLADVFGRPRLLLRANLPRQVSRQGEQAGHLATVTTMAGALGILMILGLVLGRTVLRPLGRVTRHAVRVGQKDDLTARLDFARADEIGTLAGELDRMVQRLADSRAQMVTMARRAGMAEVATDVLHNVGNVLNSVNVSVGVLAQKLRDSEIGTLRQVIRMVADHANDLPAFLAHDERGQKIPDFLGRLTDVLSGEHAQMLEEMDALACSVEHIKHVVQQQQASAGGEGLREMVRPEDLADEAIRLNGESFERHGIEVARDFEPTPPASLDRHKVLGILINLVNNARQAVKEADGGRRRLTFRIRRLGGGEQLRLEVADTGVGIAPENLERIFAFGFTTRADGRGFGLHAAANAAGELGGTLAAASEGPGRGATFTLTIPVEFKEDACPQTAGR